MNPQKLMTAIVGGVPPDLVQQDRFTIGDWASRDAFRPLDDLLQADARSHDPLAIREKDYVPATWTETVYQGHVYAIPNDTDDRRPLLQPYAVQAGRAWTRTSRPRPGRR